jgi:hypothetical protein
VAAPDAPNFEAHLTLNGVVDWEHLSTDFTPPSGSSMYSVRMDTQQALSLKLSFPLKGCMNFDKVIGRQIPQKSIDQS